MHKIHCFDSSLDWHSELSSGRRWRLVSPDGINLDLNNIRMKWPSNPFIMSRWELEENGNVHSEWRESGDETQERVTLTQAGWFCRLASKERAQVQILAIFTFHFGIGTK